MRDENDGLPFLVETLEDIEDFASGFGIERAGRLVGENDGGISHDCPSNRHALLLASREFVRLVFGLVGESDAGERGERSFFTFRFPNSLVRERKHDLLERRKPWNEIVSLEYETDLLAPEFGLFVAGELFYGRTVEHVFAVGRRVENADDVHQRRFS